MPRVHRKLIESKNMHIQLIDISTLTLPAICKRLMSYDHEVPLQYRAQKKEYHEYFVNNKTKSRTQSNNLHNSLN